MGKQILVIEDEPELGKLLELHLRDFGHVKVASDGLSGLAEARDGHYDLIVLDIMLPGLDGLEVCRRLRQDTTYTPVLMLTAKSTELDRVLGLEVGADDYLSKPFSIRELVARIKAIFRRVEALSGGVNNSPSPILEVGELGIDVTKRRVTLAGRPLKLTAKEFDLLLQFARHPGRVYSRLELLDLVWGYGHGGYEHTVNSHINRLRSKLEEDPATPRYILTVWGVGYKMNEPEETR